ncbi:MAG: 50S ribosomal protein L9 [Rhodocyclaceae bacterium]|nr:50S ribosomal protein L9 [Rhodocyclaceae bacterium]
MKVLLTKDVYKLGRAGDVKRVADGFGRNFLLPQGLAVLATPGALKQVDRIRSVAATKRAVLNNEMSGIAEILGKAVVAFASKAGETGKLYGSITPQMVVDAINKKYGLSVERRMVELQPIRTLGEHKARIRLTVDLTPEIKVVVHREGEVLAEEEVAVEEVAVEEAPAAEEAEQQQ